MVRLSEETLLLRLKALNGNGKSPRWSINQLETGSELQANYKFRTFGKTWQFLNEVASAAHGMKHHPTILTTYNKVHILVTTHDVGNKITDLDTHLATKIDEIFASYEDSL